MAGKAEEVTADEKEADGGEVAVWFIGIGRSYQVTMVRLVGSYAGPPGLHNIAGHGARATDLVGVAGEAGYVGF